MSLVNLRPILAPLVGAAICFAVSPIPGAAVKNPTVADFVARAVSVSDAKDAGPIEIVIRQWSTEEDLQTLRTTLAEHVSSAMLPVFRQTRPEAGVLLVPGVQTLGERVRHRRSLPFQFARAIDTPTGRQIVVATDHHIGFGEPPASTRAIGPSRAEFVAPTSDAAAAEPEFALLDIRFGPDGKGIGKIAPAAKVTYNQVKKIFEIENYAEQPARLIEVTSAAVR
jgi:hypothetical protein